MSDTNVRWLPPPPPPGYDERAALNDIHALLTSNSDSDRALLGDIAAIVTRTGRPMVRARDIDAVMTETPTGWPVARTDAGDTTVVVRQDPAGPGLRIEVTTRTTAERDQLTVTVDGCCLHCPCPPGSHAA